MHMMCFQNSPQQAAGVVGYPQFPFRNQFDANAAAAAAAAAAFCDAAIHFAQANIEVHKATCIITDCISLAAHLGLDIYFRRRNVVTLCEYPTTMSFVFDVGHPNNWPLVQAFELKFLADPRSAVSVNSCEVVLQAVALIPLSSEAGALCTLAQLLSYVTCVAKFFTDVSKGTLAKIENKEPATACGACECSPRQYPA